VDDAGDPQQITGRALLDFVDRDDQEALWVS
jgi:hypothetical protein